MPTGVVIVVSRGRQESVLLVKVVNRDADLLEIVSALNSLCCLPGRLHGRQQKRDANRLLSDGRELIDRL